MWLSRRRFNRPLLHELCDLHVYPVKIRGHPDFTLPDPGGPLRAGRGLGGNQLGHDPAVALDEDDLPLLHPPDQLGEPGLGLGQVEGLCGGFGCLGMGASQFKDNRLDLSWSTFKGLAPQASRPGLGEAGELLPLGGLPKRRPLTLAKSRRENSPRPATRPWPAASGQDLAMPLRADPPLDLQGRGFARGHRLAGKVALTG